MRRLNERLQTIADYVRKGERVADIGTDHALLPVYLVRNGIAPFVIATDAAPGPFAVARSRIASLTESREEAGRIMLRFGDGLEPLSPGEVDTVIIAGMGGELIASIMTKDIVKGHSFPKYILQPRTKSDRLRASLAANGFEIIEERLAEERGRKCEVLVVIEAKPS